MTTLTPRGRLRESCFLHRDTRRCADQLPRKCSPRVRTEMRAIAIAHVGILSVLMLGASMGNGAVTPAATPALAQTQPQHPRILVTFRNQPAALPSPAGTIGPRYNGQGYLVAQSAHDMARHVAVAYSLRLVASWPIKALAIHCVVYEIPDGRSVADVLNALAKDSRVTLAQPLQRFGTLATSAEVTPYQVH